MMENIVWFDDDCGLHHEALLEDEENFEIIDLSSSLVLPSYTSPVDPYFPLSPLSPYYTLCKLELKMRFPSKANHSMTCLVDMTCQILSHLVKLKGIQNQDSYILELYNTYYRQKSLIDELFSNSQAYEYDYKSSASLEATKLSKLLFVFFTF